MVKEIPHKLFYKIGEVCDLTDTQPYVLRFWESEFPQLAPKKNRSGQRMYRREDIETVERIKQLLYAEGFTIAGARKRLESADAGEAGSPEPVAAAPEAPGPAASASRLKGKLLRELQAILERMERTDRRLRGEDDPPVP